MVEQPTTPQWFPGSEYTHRALRAIAKYGPIARVTLAQILGLSQGALSRITSDLIHAGAVEEMPSNAEERGKLPFGFAAKENSDKRGRPQTALRLCAEKRTFIGANIHGTDVTVVHVDALCRPLAPCVTVPLTSTEPEEVARQIGNVVLSCISKSHPAPTSLAISIGGHVDDGRFVTFAPFLHWDGRVNFADLLEAHTELHSAVFNDLDSLLLHESWFGKAVGIARFAVLTIGSGVGYSLSENNEAIDYPDKSYGMVGHVLIDPEGPRCVSGHIGCSQCLTSDSLAEEYSSIVGHTMTFEEFAADLRAGKPHARRLGDRTCFRLGVLISIVANLAMPAKVLISGESSFIAKLNVESIRKGIEWYRHSRVAPVEFEILDFEWSHWAEAAAARAIAQYIG